MLSNGHLSLHQLDLPASQEWDLLASGWCILRIGRGVGYGFHAKQTLELAEGEVVAVPPGGAVLFRASQLGPMQLQYFNFQPELLNCLLSLSERQHFEVLAGPACRSFRHLVATHPVAGQFASLCDAGSPENPLLQRCRALSLAATLFAPTVQPTQPGAVTVSAPARFLELIQKMPEVEILSHSPDDLARLCGCSLRHFTRLFRGHFGISIRAKQTQLRLEKARQLLCETDAKVINVALDSGYRHLGLFNAMFKKHFGLTPTEFRRTKNKKPRPSGATPSTILLGLVCSLLVQLSALISSGATPPPAEASATNAPTFVVKGYEVEGNSLLTDEQLQKILGEHTGPAVTFETIRGALAELQLAYRGRGYVTVGVSLPQQQLTNGLVKVRVTEGRLAEIHVSNNRYFSSNNIMSALPSLQTGMLLNSLVLQQELDRANLSRDRQIYPEIGPGPEPGTTALRLKVQDRLPLHARVELNNYSTPGTPDLRFNTALQYNNLWQLNHQLGVQYSFSPTDYKDRDTLPDFWNKPLIANYSAFYRFPLNNFSGVAERRSVPIGQFGYDEVAKRFQPPPLAGEGEMIIYASRSDSDTGNVLQSEEFTPAVLPPEGGLQIHDAIHGQTLTVNDDLGFRVNEPVPDIWGVASTASAGMDYKYFKSRVLQTRSFGATIFIPINVTGPPFETVTPSGAPPSSTQTTLTSVNYIPFSVAWTGGRADKWGNTSFILNDSFNVAGLLGNQDDFRRVAGSAQANGTYNIINGGVSRDQKLFTDVALRLSADGQWANQPLISNEQFGIGGTAGVRGYRDGQEYGDTGWRVLFEPHTDLFDIGMVDGTMPMLVRLFTFMDYGRVYSLNRAVGARQSVSLWGAGFGFSGTIGQRMDFRFICGVPLLDIPNVKAGTPRISFSVGMQF